MTRRLRALPTAPAVAAGEAPLRLADYRRVSVVGDRGGETFHSPDVQSAANRRTAERLGGVVVGTYEDLDVSGAIAPSSRAGLGQALDDVRAGLLDGILVYDLSRWSRDTASGLAELQAIAAAGGRVISSSETVDLTTPGGIFATTVQLAAAQLKRDEARRAWRDVRQRRAELGLWHGQAPMGYRREVDSTGATTGSGRPRTTGQLVVDEAKAAAVVELFERYAAGESMAALQRDLARRGIARKVDLRGILSSRAYVGEVRDRAGRAYRAAHEPIVAGELFDRVQRRLELERGAPRRRADHSLAGLVVCDACGRRLCYQSRPASAGGPYYRDVNGHADLGCPGMSTARVDDVEAVVLEAVGQLAQRLKLDAGERAAARARRTRAGVDVDRLRREVVETETAIGRLAVDHARRVVTEVGYRVGTEQLERELAALRAQLATAEAAASQPGSSELAAAAASLENLWPRMTPSERRAALSALVVEVRVRRAARYREPVRDRVEVVWR